MHGLFDSVNPSEVPEHISYRQQLFGWSREDVEILVQPMAETGHEPVGSMGNDASLAVLSEKPQLLYNYFKQLFAQVTNPPIDPIREELVMSLTEYIGAVGSNILVPTESHCKMVRLNHPILTNWISCVTSGIRALKVLSSPLCLTQRKDAQD